MERERAARAIDVAVAVDDVAAAEDAVDLLGAQGRDGDAEPFVLGVHVADQPEATHFVSPEVVHRPVIVHDRARSAQ